MDQGMESAFLAVSGAFEVLLALKLAVSLRAQRRQLYALCRKLAAFLLCAASSAAHSGDSGVAWTNAEEAMIETQILEQRLKMARRYAKALASISFVIVASVQWNLFWDNPRWMTSALAWMTLGIFALLVSIQLYPPLLSGPTLNAWYFMGIVLVTVGSAPQFITSERLSAISMFVIVVFRLPMAIFAKHPVLVVIGNISVVLVVLYRALAGYVESTAFTMTMEVSGSFMVIGLSFLMHTALRQIAEQSVMCTKATTELDAASALLQLTCDAVLELDEALRITTHSPQLTSMLLWSSPGAKLAGTSFTDFVATVEEKNRAVQILNSAHAEMTMHNHTGGGSDQTNSSGRVSAKAFHTHLVDSCRSRFRTEVFQVNYRRLDGSACHLLGLRDFTDQSSLAERAVDAIRDPGDPGDPATGSTGSRGSGLDGGACLVSLGASASPTVWGASEADTRVLLLEVDIGYGHICAASAVLEHLVGKPLCEIFPVHVADSFRRLWDDILELNAKGELAQKAMSFGNIEMLFSPKKTAQISGTVEVTKTATGELEFFVCFRMPQVFVKTHRRPSKRLSRSTQSGPAAAAAAAGPRSMGSPAQLQNGSLRSFASQDVMKSAGSSSGCSL